ncbi:DUF2306 domain-containing protein [Brachybacterium sp. NPDC056505]|uniref:DUF2306 domain-containing protein n=1 Tax=Brachybacterium sp. NPDC056505 TaxID=3345843 RepID=UPI00366BB902
MGTPVVVIVLHALGALIVLTLGPIQIFRRHRDRAHRWLGRTWAISMVLTCVSSFFIHPQGLSWLHALAVWTLFSITMGVVNIRRGNVSAHRVWMIGSYLGTCIAFVFAILSPGRLIPHLLRSDPVLPLVFFTGVVALAVAWAGMVVRVRGTRRDARRPLAVE